MSHARHGRSAIAIGEKESFIFPIPVGFVSERAGIGGSPATIESPIIRIDHAQEISFSVMHFGTAANFDLTVEAVIKHDGIDGSNGSFLNPVFADPVTITAAQTSTNFHASLSPPLPTTEALRLNLKNNLVGAIVAVAPPQNNVATGGVGIQVRVHMRS